MVSETEDKVRREYVYHPGTDLLAKQLLVTLEYASRVIRKRRFYDYDCNGALVCEIIDDGSTEDRKTLKEPQKDTSNPSQTRKNYPLDCRRLLRRSSMTSPAARKDCCTKRSINMMTKVTSRFRNIMVRTANSPIPFHGITMHKGKSF